MEELGESQTLPKCHTKSSGLSPTHNKNKENKHCYTHTLKANLMHCLMHCLMNGANDCDYGLSCTRGNAYLSHSIPRVSDSE